MKTLKVEKTGCWGMIDGVFQQLPVGHEFVAADVPAAFAGRVSVVGEVEEQALEVATPGIRDEYSRLPDCVLRFMQSGLLSRKAIMAAHTVLTACCDDDIGDLVGWMKPGKSRKRGFVWRPGSMTPEIMVVVAQNLMVHGIIGKAKVRKLQRYETNETTAEFRAADYIMAARNHFGISREEAENLTMTEFAMMINAKYPNQNGFTREEFDSVMSEDDKRWNAMLAAEEAGKMNKRLG